MVVGTLEAIASASAVDSGNIAILVSAILSVVLLAVILFVWFKAAKNMAGIAADKGYTEKKWFHYCFWLGLAGFLMVCAMPDKKRR